MLELCNSTLDNAAISKRKPLPCTYLSLIYEMSKMTASKVAVRAMKNLKIATLMKVDRSHQKFQNRKKTQNGLQKPWRINICTAISPLGLGLLIAHNNMLNREEQCVMAK